MGIRNVVINTNEILVGIKAVPLRNPFTGSMKKSGNKELSPSIDRSSKSIDKVRSRKLTFKTKIKPWRKP